MQRKEESKRFDAVSKQSAAAFEGLIMGALKERSRKLPDLRIAEVPDKDTHLNIGSIYVRETQISVIRGVMLKHIELDDGSDKYRKGVFFTEDGLYACAMVRVVQPACTACKHHPPTEHVPWWYCRTSGDYLWLHYGHLALEAVHRLDSVGP